MGNIVSWAPSSSHPALSFVVLARAFARPLRQLSSFPAELYTRRIAPASLTAAVAILVGFGALFFSGVCLAACFLFVIFAVGVEDCGVRRALTRSWQLSRGHRLRLGVFVLVVGISGILVAAVPAMFQLAGAVALGDIVVALPPTDLLYRGSPVATGSIYTCLVQYPALSWESADTQNIIMYNE